MTLPPPSHPSLVATEPARLFVYGSLAFPEVMQVLLGRVPDSTPASVTGWRVAALVGQTGAAMVSAEAIAHGRLVLELGGPEWRLIDAFEDVCELRLLDLTDGRPAWCYVCADQRQVLSDDWNAEQFERDGFVAYLRHCARWRRDYQARAVQQ